jgi:phenylpropionate dioxygenase-like ring-hydroxylating dioxygenase large terminal subunit
MTQLTVDTIGEIVRNGSGRAGCPPDFPALPDVPTGRYYDPAYGVLQMDHLWMKSWLMAGHISEIPDHNSYKLFERLGRSVIISRGADGQIRALHNTCRHRGSAVVLEPKGKTARFTCPYHGWTYGTDGRLLAVPEANEFPCLDKDARGLVPVRCETWRGFIFINFDRDAGSLATFLKPAARQVAAFPLEQFAVKLPHTYKLDCNWNVGFDNTLETYHVPALHPVSLAPYLDGKSFTVALLDEGHSLFVTRKKSATIFAPAARVENVAGQMFADYNVCISVFPNSYLVLDATGFISHSYWPDGPSRCVIDLVQFGPESHDLEYYQELHKTIQPVLDEDWRLFAGIQRSIETGVSTGIPLNYQERAVYWLQQQIDCKIGSERIPERLRVAARLTPEL